MKLLASVLTLFLLSMNLSAAPKISFIGYQKDPKAPTRNLKGPIHKFLETDSDFKLIIGDNAAFYLLPKGTKAPAMREKLQSLQKEKTPVSAIVNAFNRQILTLETN